MPIMPNDRMSIIPIRESAGKVGECQMYSRVQILDGDGEVIFSRIRGSNPTKRDVRDVASLAERVVDKTAERYRIVEVEVSVKTVVVKEDELY